MDIYSLFKRFSNLKSPRLKLLAIFGLHLTGKRYMGVYLDPVLACNLRCKMCYFSDENKRKEMKGIMSDEQIQGVADSFFRRALKLQIGCGAEPTLYKKMPELIRLAKSKGVPFISITTNANLLTEKLIADCLEAGANEFTISLHGVIQDTYEFMMTNAHYEKFIEALKLLSEAKSKYDFKIRINYTINEDNLEELAEFFDKMGFANIDILQLRPISNIGDTEYHNFSHSKIIERYDDILLKVKNEAFKRNIVCIVPTKKQLTEEISEDDSQLIMEATYCYVSPNYCWKKDFDLNTDTFDSYSKKHNRTKQLFKNIFYSRKDLDRDKKHLNYEIN